jgi:hypothetical protein
LLLYTDGLIERREELLDVGLARLADLARDAGGSAVEDLCSQELRDRKTGADPGSRGKAEMCSQFAGTPGGVVSSDAHSCSAGECPALDEGTAPSMVG